MHAGEFIYSDILYTFDFQPVKSPVVNKFLGSYTFRFATASLRLWRLSYICLNQKADWSIPMKNPWTKNVLSSASEIIWTFFSSLCFTDRQGRSFVWGSRSQSTLQVATKIKYSQIQTNSMNRRAAGTQNQSPLIGRIWPWKNLFYVYVCRCVSVQIQKLTACLLWQSEVQQGKWGYWKQSALQSLWFFCRFIWLFYFFVFILNQ